MDCEGSHLLGYSEFSKQLHQKAASLHIPISGSLEVTQRCNMRCTHCYIPLPIRKNPRQAELSLTEIQRILDEIKDAGCLWLLLTGGEPLLRTDLLDIYTYAKRKGFLLTLFTNGTLITPHIADVLCEWRPFNIEITLYGYSQETYERITGIPGSHARCMRGIELLLERHLPLKLKTMLMTVNRHELGEMQAYAKSLGVEFRFDPILNAGLDGSLLPTSLRLSPDEIATIERADPQRSQLWPESLQRSKDLQIDNTRLYICAAGANSFHIDSFGQLSLCVTARRPSYDLRSGTFKRGWEEFIQQLRSLEHGREFSCGSCDLRPICAQCPAQALLEQGHPEQRVEFLCEVTHRRWEVFSQSILQPS
jgi:radical SAM protein with 4Fe4S-binding SPASM domain